MVVNTDNVDLMSFVFGFQGSGCAFGCCFVCVKPDIRIVEIVTVACLLALLVVIYSNFWFWLLSAGVAVHRLMCLLDSLTRHFRLDLESRVCSLKEVLLWR